MKENIIAIVCPDIHGRSLWKESINEYDGSVPFIFLGDYLDSYESEKINPEEVKKNLKKYGNLNKNGKAMLYYFLVIMIYHIKNICLGVNVFRFIQLIGFKNF